MTHTKTAAILGRLADDWRHEEAQLCKQFGDVVLPQSMRARMIKDTEAIEAAVEMIERLEKMEAALRDHHKNAMCEGCDHSHPLTQLRLSAYQQSKLYADTVSVLEKLK